MGVAVYNGKTSNSEVPIDEINISVRGGGKNPSTSGLGIFAPPWTSW